MSFSVKNKIFILFVSVIIISVGTVGWFGFVSAKRAYISSALSTSTGETKALSNEMMGILETIPNDVLYNSEFYALKRMFIWAELADEQKTNYWKNLYISTLKDYLLNKKFYYKIKILDAYGHEKIVIKYNELTNKVIKVRDEDLENKSYSNYFIHAINLRKGEFYISKMSLNVENSKIEKPFVPVVRYSTPIVNENGETKGVIVLSFNANNILNKIEKAQTVDKLNNKREYHLLNSDGGYLYEIDKTKRWAFQLGTAFNFKNDHKNAMKNLKDKDKDEAVFIQDDTIYSMNKIYPNKVDNKERFWYLVTTLNIDVALLSLDEFIEMFFIILVSVLVLGLYFVNMYISKLMTPLTKVTAQLKALSGGEIKKKNIKYKADDEIGLIISSTAILMDAIETTINQANAVAGGDFTKDIELLGKNDQLGLSLREMTKRLKEISSLANELSMGNYDVNVIVKGSDDELGLSLMGMVEYLETITKIAESISVGELNVNYKIKGNDDRLGLAIVQMIKYLKSILKQAKAITVEDYTNTINVKSNDDELGLAISTMTDILKLNSQKNKEEIYFSDGVAQFNDKLSGITDITELSNEAITIASRYVNANRGAIYIFDKDKAELTLSATFAFDEEDKYSSSFKLGEGVVGQVALEKKYMLLKGSAYKARSGTAIFQQKEVYVFPLIFEGIILGVAEIMSLEEFTKVDKEYFEKIADIFVMALYTAGQNTQIKLLLEKSQHAYEELQIQSEEIQETNVEMQEQQLQLTLQSEELKDKNRNLAKAKREIDQRAKELEKASKYKSEFLANMSHELRTPLNSIILLSKLLTMNTEQNLDEDSIKKASVINRAGNNLLLLINDILDLSKIESGKMNLDISELASADIIEEMRGLFGAIADEKEVVFVTQDNFKDKFMTDNTKLAQVLKNLLSNAFKFTKKGSVVLGIDSRENELVISVKDTGIGIQNDKLDNIFDAFKQVDGSISREYGGTGLGLSISKTIIELLHGTITVESQFGRGTTFVVVLPLLDKLASSSTKKETSFKSVAEVQHNSVDTISIIEDDISSLDTEMLSNKNILIVDDDSRNIFTLTAVLEDVGAEIYSAFNGKEALEVLGVEKIDLILMDIMMPVMDGSTAIKVIKSNTVYKDVPIIAITAKTMPQDKQNCLDAGANDYLSKPIHHNALISMVKAWVK